MKETFGKGYKITVVIIKTINKKTHGKFSIQPVLVTPNVLAMTLNGRSTHYG